MRYENKLYEEYEISMVMHLCYHHSHCNSIIKKSDVFFIIILIGSMINSTKKYVLYKNLKKLLKTKKRNE